MDQVFKQLRFRIDRDGVSYSDAIVLSEEEFNKLSKEDIDAIKEERFQNWKNVVSNPPKPVELKDLPKEDLELQVESIDRQIQELQTQKTAVSEAILTAKPKPIIEQIKDKIDEVIGGL